MTSSSPARLALAIALAAGLQACSSDAGEPDAVPTDVDASVLGTDSFQYEPAAFEIPAGGARIALECGPSLPHNIVVEVADGEETVVECSGGQIGVGDVDLEAGSHVFFCDIPGHRAAGMEGTLTVG